MRGAKNAPAAFLKRRAPRPPTPKGLTPIAAAEKIGGVKNEETAKILRLHKAVPAPADCGDYIRRPVRGVQRLRNARHFRQGFAADIHGPGRRAAPDVAHNRGRAAAADGVCAQGDIRVFERLPHDLFVAGSPAEAQTAHIRQNPKLPRGVFRQVHHGRPAHEADKRHRERPDCATVVLLRNLPPAPASARRPRLPALPLLHKGAGCDALHIFRGGAVLYSARTDDTQKHEAVCGQSADGP